MTKSKTPIKHVAAAEKDTLISALKERFESNTHRHKKLDWATVASRLEANPDAIWSLNEMERTGGEPDVIGADSATGEILFVDCAPESPSGRRSCCYDHEAWASRKEHRPDTNAVDMATEMGVEILTEKQYRELQKLGKLDQKTSSWVQTPPEIRKLGGALFCDRRYDQVFLYHNGAQSYYAARGFRAMLRV